MPIESFANKWNVILARGPVIPVVIGSPFAQPQPQEAVQKPQEAIKIPDDLHQTGALLDTGASNCCINPSLANRLNLPIVGYANSFDASMNQMRSKVRSASIGFILKGTAINMIPAIEISELPKDIPNHNLIIGRSLMAKFRAMYFCFKTGEYMIHF